MLKVDELNQLANGDGVIAHSADNEPLFTLCGRDPLAGEIIREWADRLEMSATVHAELTEHRKLKIAEARRLSLLCDAWPNKKLPD